ncbi:MAG TPA: hypothetical protein VFA12_05765 [Stellaceae bacterium]|nr:hypothetical protein [Stellaceae bacterium]
MPTDRVKEAAPPVNGRTLMRPWIGRWRALLDRFGYLAAAADQIALSLFSFVLTLALLRVLTPLQFSVVTFWLAVSQLTIGLQNAAVGVPLTVFLPAMAEPREAERLEGAIASVNLALIAVTAAAVFLIDALADAEWAPTSVALALAIPLYLAVSLSREFQRTTAFSRRNMAMLLAVDAPYLAVTGVCLAAMLLWPARFGGTLAAFATLSLGCVASALCVHGRGGWGAQLFRRGWTSAYKPTLRDVGWGLAGVVATNASTRGYVYVTTALSGLAALGAINAVGVLFRPIAVLSAAWGRRSLPALAASLARGEAAAVRRHVRVVAAATFAGSIAWATALWLCWLGVERYVLAAKYPDAHRLLLPWTCAAVLAQLEYVIGVGLQALREFRFLAYTQFIGGVLSIAGTAAAIWWGGYTAAMYGIAFSGAVCLAMEWIRLDRRLASRPSPTATPNDEVSLT